MSRPVQAEEEAHFLAIPIQTLINTLQNCCWLWAKYLIIAQGVRIKVGLFPLFLTPNVTVAFGLLCVTVVEISKFFFQL